MPLLEQGSGADTKCNDKILQIKNEFQRINGAYQWIEIRY